MMIVGGLADPIEKIDADIVFGLGKIHLARKGVHVANKGLRNLAEPGIGRPRHRIDYRRGDINDSLNDSPLKNLVFERRRRCRHRNLPYCNRLQLLMQSIAVCQAIRHNARDSFVWQYTP